MLKIMYLSTSKNLSICVCGKDDQRHSIVFNVKKYAVMNTFIQWKETISDAYLTDTPLCFPFIEPNISPLLQGSLANIPSNTLIGVTSSPFLLGGTVKHYMPTYESEDPEFVQQFLKSLYVDDMLGGDEKRPQCIQVLLFGEQMNEGRRF